MKNRNYLWIGFASLFVFFTICSIFMNSSVREVRLFGTGLVSLWIPHYVSRGFLHGILHEWSAWCFCMLLFYAVGCVLPDIFVRFFIIRKYLHKRFGLDINLMCFTHNIWIVCILCIVSLLHPYLFAVWSGYVVHLLIDSVSYYGIPWFYGIKRYSVIDGHVVSLQHKIKLYHVNTKSERVFVWSVVCIFVAFVLYFGIWQANLYVVWRYMLR